MRAGGPRSKIVHRSALLLAARPPGAPAAEFTDLAGVRDGIGFAREKEYKINYKGVILPHKYFADFVVMDKVLLEAKAIERLTESHVKQVLNYLAASRLKVGLLANFGEDSLTWKHVIL